MAAAIVAGNPADAKSHPAQEGPV